MMKLVKGSFGYRDQDWMYPEETYVEYVEDTASTDVDTLVHTNMYREVENGYPYVYVTTTDTYNVDVSELTDDYIDEALDDVLYGELEANSTYQLSGTVEVVVSIPVYHDPSSSEKYVDESGVEVLHTYADVTWRKQNTR